MSKKEKFKKLTYYSGYDKHTIPIFNACAGNRTVPLLKTLMSSYCMNNCKFCHFRCSRRISRERWKPNELADVTFNLWKKRKIQGLFLSSSVEKDPDSTVEQQIETAEILRKKGFKEYIHLRLMPGVSKDLVKRSVLISDRVGINIEMPDKEHYEDMKLFLHFKQDILKRLKWLAEEIKKAQEFGKCSAGLDSQIIVGASDETDKEIIRISDMIYNKLNAQRIYYSGFKPVRHTPLEKKKPVDPWREYRLYQSSFLLRDYGITKNDFVFNENENLNLKEDPKFTMAKQNELNIDINEATFNELIKIPGVGLKSAKNIIEKKPIKNVQDLKSCGVILKRAQPFIELHGIHQTHLSKWFK